MDRESNGLSWKNFKTPAILLLCCQALSFELLFFFLIIDNHDRFSHDKYLSTTIGLFFVANISPSLLLLIIIVEVSYYHR